ncbi:2-phospho-L-lactate guanylyltransferase [Rhodococcoides corynebacterioides]|uniref:2-phospho-L-lactate guanylyltransferase n=1 Tax=Rhodococcoides corynebacterioides TaxID=53972 RepID=UPI001C9B96C4|nr:2-phospho-L-lactate guanylyltransferase [Rhodococcus corynebacterioides]MBY6350141.1 2-phospho-L-lactate guanylyltransferase [Rhodococcus corynebacterioides]
MSTSPHRRHPAAPGDPGPGVHVVLAVKNLAGAKSRLASALPGSRRADLVVAMLLDTATAAASSSFVVGWSVVTPDPRVADAAARAGATTVSEPASPVSEPASPGGGGIDGLNRALSAAHDAVRGSGVDVVALAADLPALTTAEFDAAYRASTPSGRSVVVDHTGSGTSALVVRGTGVDLHPLFGPDSAARHVSSGAVALTGPWPGLRLDVDTEDDVRRAVALGVGDRTRAVLTNAGWPVSEHRPLQ